jgi:hypothetical protein
MDQLASAPCETVLAVRKLIAAGLSGRHGRGTLVHAFASTVSGT